MRRSFISWPAGTVFTAFFGALSFDNYVLIGSDPLYVLSFVKSVEIAAFSTLLLLIIGYPIAYGIARTPRRVQAVLMMLVMLPFWTAFLIRIYAWMNILQHDGPLNRLLLALHVVSTPPVWLATDTAIYIGIVYSYLPFMVLPLYATLEKLDESLIEAAADLGCPRSKMFWHVTLPLSAPGVLAGVLLCFIPIVGEFVIPDLLGGSQVPMIGQTIWTEFFGNKDWPAAAAVAVVLVGLLVTPIVIFRTRRCARWSGVDHAQDQPVQCPRHRARPGLSLSADRHPGDLLVQRVAPGHGVGRLVDALVRRAHRRRRYP